MSKLFQSKKILTLEETAKHLSNRFPEPVGVADVLQLSLDGKLTLSVNFVNPVSVLLGEIIPLKDANYRKNISSDYLTQRFGVDMEQMADYMEKPDVWVMGDDITGMVLNGIDIGNNQVIQSCNKYSFIIILTKLKVIMIG